MSEPGKQADPDPPRVRMPRATLDDVVDDHQSLETLLTQLDDPGMERQVYLTRLGHLLDWLREHFEMEENSSLYQKVPVQIPNHKPELDRLRLEHAILLGETRSLIQDLQSEMVTDLQDRIHNLQKSIRHHEVSEGEILQSYYNRDTSGGRG